MQLSAFLCKMEPATPATPFTHPIPDGYTLVNDEEDAKFVKTMTDMVSEGQHLIRFLKEKIREMGEKIRGMKEIISNLKETLKSVCGTNLEMRETIHNLEEENLKLRAEITEMRSKLD